MLGNAVFSGVFELREGVSEEEFLPTLKTFSVPLIKALHPTISSLNARL
jgi:hypothetical protein